MLGNIFKKYRKNVEGNIKVVRNQSENYSEYDVCNYFIDELIKLGKDESLFRIEQRSDRYLSLIYGNNNFLRVHISKVDNTKWITIAMFDSNRGIMLKYIILNGLLKLNLKYIRRKKVVYSCIFQKLQEN